MIRTLRTTEPAWDGPFASQTHAATSIICCSDREADKSLRIAFGRPAGAGARGRYGAAGMALLMGIVAYLTRGGGKLPVLLAEIRNSARLGPKMATWIEQHEADLLTNPALQQGIRAGAGGAAED